MKEIPVTFTHKGKQYSGIFSNVQGAGGTGVWHLTINKYFKGRLRISAFNKKWVFDGEFEDLAEWFGEIVSRPS